MTNSTPASNSTYEPPKYATSPRLTLGDLETTITVGEALEIANLVAERVRDNIEANIEHWTDDEGLHMIPFTKDLNEEVPQTVTNAIVEYLLSNNII